VAHSYSTSSTQNHKVRNSTGMAPIALRTLRISSK
jgi:hypothetical protein